MSTFFGSGFTPPPNAQYKLRQDLPQNQFTSPVRQLGAIPVSPPFPMLAQQQAPPPPQVPVQQAPPQNVRGIARPALQSTALPSNSPIGPTSYKVMKKGEAPCPVCRG
jgi:hypothetical protein